MSRDDVRTNLVSWNADSDSYQKEHAAQLNRWDVFGWGTWDVAGLRGRLARHRQKFPGGPDYVAQLDGIFPPPEPARREQTSPGA